MGRRRRRRRHAERHHHADKRHRQPEPLHGVEAVARQHHPRADHHEEWRQIDEQRGPRRRGVEQPAVDQQELQSEQRTRDQTGSKRAVTRGNRQSAQPHDPEHHQRRQRRTDGALRQRRHVMNGELDRRLVEAPGQADQHHQHHAGGVERPRMACGNFSHQGYRDARQCAQTPPISITGAFGVKPAARAAALS